MTEILFEEDRSFHSLVGIQDSTEANSCRCHSAGSGSARRQVVLEVLKRHGNTVESGRQRWWRWSGRAKRVKPSFEQRRPQPNKFGEFERRASVIPNYETGVLAVRATKRQHEKIQEFLTSVMSAARREVLIEATIAEVKSE
ncbi:MAG: hypothetical protein IPG34_00085 [Rhodocyclaceae bacterium]|nr:hypothetical protein [Rhodocyclaceae bacterium]